MTELALSVKVAAARERPSALDVERLLHAADIALGVQEVARQAGNADLFAALEPLRHAVRAVRLTEPDAEEGTEPPSPDGEPIDPPFLIAAPTPDTTEATRLWDEMYPKSGPAMRRATPDTTDQHR